MSTQSANLSGIENIAYNSANVTQLIVDNATVWLKEGGIVYYIGKTLWVNGVSSTVSSINGTVVFFTQADGTTGSFDGTDPGGSGVTEGTPNQTSYSNGQTVWIDNYEKTIQGISGTVITFTDGTTFDTANPGGSTIATSAPANTTPYSVNQVLYVDGVAKIVSSLVGSVITFTDGTVVDTANLQGVVITTTLAGDQDGDGIPDSSDPDADNDGLIDSMDLEAYPNVYLKLSEDIQTGNEALINQTITSPNLGQHDASIYSTKKWIAPVHLASTSVHEFHIALDSAPTNGTESWASNKWYYIEIMGWVPGSSSFPEWLDVRLNKSSDAYDVVQPIKWYSDDLSGDDIKSNNWNNSAMQGDGTTYYPTFTNPGELGDWNGVSGTGVRLIAYTGEMSSAPDELRLRLNKVQTFGSQSSTNPQPVIRQIKVRMIDASVADGPSIADAQPEDARTLRSSFSLSQTGGVQFGGVGNNAGVTYTPGDTYVADMTGLHTMVIGNEYFVSYANLPTEYYRARLVRMQSWPRFEPYSGSFPAPMLYFEIVGGDKDGNSIPLQFPGAGSNFGTRISSQGVNSAPVLPAGGTLMN